jgi:hypothetical protein
MSSPQASARARGSKVNRPASRAPRREWAAKLPNLRSPLKVPGFLDRYIFQGRHGHRWWMTGGAEGIGNEAHAPILCNVFRQPVLVRFSF